MRSSLGVILLVVACGQISLANATPVTAEFASAPDVTELGGFLHWSEAGIDFSAANGSFFETQFFYGAVRWFGPSATPVFTFAMTDGSLFELKQLVLFEATWVGGECCLPNATADIVGYLADGGTVSINNLDGRSNEGVVNFGDDWRNLTHVSIVDFDRGYGPSSGNELRIDSVTVTSVVPVPATALLFGSGLALLGWFRRLPRNR